MRQWWAERDYATIVSHHGSPAHWSKGRALREGVALTDADTFILADADCIPTLIGLTDALEAVEGNALWAMPHTNVYRLTEVTTQATILSDDDCAFETTVPPYRGVAGGGITILTRDAWETVAGVDPRFIGWGAEDHAFGWALETLCGQGYRSPEPLYHLWHPVQGPKLPVSPLSQRLLGRYRQAKGRPERMSKLVEESRGA